MTASNDYQIGPITYDPKNFSMENEEPVHVVDVDYNGRLYHIPCELYDKNIQEGKTKFCEYNNNIVMVTPEEYKQLKMALKHVNKK